MLPAIDNEGKILMQSEYHILLAPNGNGALFDSIAKSEDLRS